MRSGSAGGTLSARAHSLPARGTSHVTGAHRFGRQPCTNSGRGHAFPASKRMLFPVSVSRSAVGTIICDQSTGHHDQCFSYSPTGLTGRRRIRLLQRLRSARKRRPKSADVAAIPVPAGEFLCFRDTFEDAKSRPEEPDQSHFGKNTPCISASPEPTYPG